MYSKNVMVVNPTGLHARPAATLATEAAKFASKIEVRNASKDGDFKDAKSMIAIMNSGITQNDEVELRAEGDDEVAAVDTLVALIEGGFGE